MSNRCNGVTKCGKRCKLKRRKEEEVVYCKLHENQKKICSICLNLIDKKIILDCEHTFCKKCILKWLCINSNCPMCRGNINNNIMHQSINFGLKNKIILLIDEYHVNLNLHDLPLDLNDMYLNDLKGIYLNELEWDNLSFDKSKLKITVRKCVMRINNEDEYNHFKKYNKIFLFE